jgi:hypothetical protein
MSRAADIRAFHAERCTVHEIAQYLAVPRWYVVQVLRLAGEQEHSCHLGERRPSVESAFREWIRTP